MTNEFLEDFNQELAISVTDEHRGMRLDQVCSMLSGLTRSRIEQLCADGQILVEGRPAKKNHRLQGTENIVILSVPCEDIDAAPENIPLDVVYEDDHIIVVNKPADMVVHPAPGSPDHTLVNALLYHCGSSLSGINGKARPGIVHRLDKDTSGLILCAKNDTAHVRIAQDIQEHKYEKNYQALIYGHLKDDAGTIRTAIGRSKKDRKKMAAYPWDSPNAKNAVTHYKVIENFTGYSLVMLQLETGRTHQIRVHLQSLGHPIVADPLYAPGRETLGVSGQCLHACELAFQHPITNKPLRFVSPLPDRIQSAIGKIR